jgi:hypothetical protein
MKKIFFVIQGIPFIVNVKTDIISSITARLIGRGQSVILVMMYVKTVFLSFLCILTIINLINLQSMGLIRFLLTKDSRTSAKVTDCFKPKMKI